MIYYDTTKKCATLQAMNDLGVSMNLCGDNTGRATTCDEGTIHNIGKGKMGNGLIGTYNLTHSNQYIKEMTSRITSNKK